MLATFIEYEGDTKDFVFGRKLTCLGLDLEKSGSVETFWRYAESRNFDVF
jgi:hypothetical protein